MYDDYSHEALDQLFGIGKFLLEQAQSVGARTYFDQALAIANEPDDPETKRIIHLLVGNRTLKDRIAQIEEVIRQMDFRWDNSFITDKDEYLQKRLTVQQELEQLKPIPIDNLEMAADVLTNFESH